MLQNLVLCPRSKASDATDWDLHISHYLVSKGQWQAIGLDVRGFGVGEGKKTQRWTKENKSSWTLGHKTRLLPSEEPFQKSTLQNASKSKVSTIILIILQSMGIHISYD